MSVHPFLFPGGLELVIGNILFFVIVFGVILSARWVYNDATARDSEWTWQWGVSIGFLSVFGFVVVSPFGILLGLLGVVIYHLTRANNLEAPS